MKSGMRSPTPLMSSGMRSSTALVFVILVASSAAADGGSSCDVWLPPLREVKGRKVGPSSCRMQESIYRT